MMERRPPELVRFTKADIERALEAFGSEGPEAFGSEQPQGFGSEEPEFGSEYPEPWPSDEAAALHAAPWIHIDKKTLGIPAVILGSIAVVAVFVLLGNRSTPFQTRASSGPAIPMREVAINTVSKSPTQVSRALGLDGSTLAGAGSSSTIPAPVSSSPVLAPPVLAALESTDSLQSRATSNASSPARVMVDAAPAVDIGVVSGVTIAAAPAASGTPPENAVAASTPARSDSIRPAAPAPAEPVSVASTDSGAIEDVLDRFRSAFHFLDVGATREVWPTVNERALDRAFERLEEQDLSFENCEIAVTDVRADVNCRGSARYVPKVGNRSSRIDQGRWTFNLRKVNGQWLIQTVEAR
jgi:hypothetical protein